jgi:hypothetical protein
MWYSEWNFGESLGAWKAEKKVAEGTIWGEKGQAKKSFVFFANILPFRLDNIFTRTFKNILDYEL